MKRNVWDDIELMDSIGQASGEETIMKQHSVFVENDVYF